MFSIWNYRPACTSEWYRVCPWSPPLLWSWLPRHKHTSLHLQGWGWSSPSLSSQLGRCLLRQGTCFPSPMEIQQELSAELTGCHARSRWLTIFCPICPSSCSKTSSVTVRRVCAAWCTPGCPKPWAAPSPGTTRPQLQSRRRGGPYSSAWRCSLEDRNLPIPRSEVLPIFMHFPQPFQNRKGQHFIAVNDFLSSSVLKATGLQRIWELKMVIDNRAPTYTEQHLPGMWQQVITLMGLTGPCFLSNR